MKRLVSIFGALALMLASAVFIGPPAVMAATDCTFTTQGAVMKLDADCTTDETIVIPDGFTLDGKGHTITAVDPPSGSFLGAVVKSGGATAHVKHLTITALDLASACHPAGPVDTRLRGILFEGTSGSITHSTVTGVNQGSGCQEGNAIEVRNAPFDGTHPNTQTVKIEHNKVFEYQKTGIVANGDVDVSIRHNTVGASATQANLAANSIQVGFGGLASVENNKITGNSWCCASAVGTAILLFDSGPGLSVRHNKIDGNADVGIYILADNAKIEHNSVIETGADGFYDIGIGNYGSDNTIRHNSVGGYETPYDGVDVEGGKNKVKKDRPTPPGPGGPGGPPGP